MYDGKLPLGILKQAIMKIDSATSDIHEALLDDDLDESQRSQLNVISEELPRLEAMIYYMINSEMNESEFMDEEIEMDEIDKYPEKEIDILDQEI